MLLLSPTSLLHRGVHQLVPNCKITWNEVISHQCVFYPFSQHRLAWAIPTMVPGCLIEQNVVIFGDNMTYKRLTQRNTMRGYRNTYKSTILCIS